MGFHIRKSLSFGPLRLNLSKGGLGISTGIKGFRIGTGPRGNYIQAGMGGLYYRQTLGQRRKNSRYGGSAPAPEPEPATEKMEAVESGAASQMTDHSAADLLQELRSKRALHRSGPLSLATLAVTLLLSFMQPHWAWVGAAILLAGLTVFLFWWDQQRKTTILFYDLQPPFLPAFEDLHDAFENLAQCRGQWNVEAQTAVLERKYSGGAHSRVHRSAIATQMKCPPMVRVNLPIPCLPAGRQLLYFFPDRVLVYDHQGIGAVSYADLRSSFTVTRFTERASVPSDAQTVGYTWQYVNKDGGPDRRFKDNPQLPLVLYAELSIQSASGLNELFMFSNQEAVSLFLSALHAYRDCLTSAQSAHPPVTAEELPATRATLAGPTTQDTVGAAVAGMVAPPTATKQFYYFDQSIQGPFTAEELAALAEQGTVTDKTQICSLENQQWVAYRNFLSRI